VSTQSNFLLDRVIGFVDEAGAVNVIWLHFSKVYDTGLVWHIHKQVREACPKASFYRLRIRVA